MSGFTVAGLFGRMRAKAEAVEAKTATDYRGLVLALARGQKVAEEAAQKLVSATGLGVDAVEADVKAARAWLAVVARANDLPALERSIEEARRVTTEARAAHEVASTALRRAEANFLRVVSEFDSVIEERDRHSEARVHEAHRDRVLRGEALDPQWIELPSERKARLAAKPDGLAQPSRMTTIGAA